MTPISAKSRANPDVPQQKPPSKVRAKLKLIRINPADLVLIKRAAKTLRPRAQTVSYFIVEAAIARARRELNLSA